VRISKLPKLAKLAPRAAIGYLVGYEARNIWRIWIPSYRRVIRARDVQFNETEFYDSSLPNQRIHVYEDNPSQPIYTLEDDEAIKILDDIDIPNAPEQTLQQDLGGGSPSMTANLDPAAPSQSAEASHSPHFQLTSDQDDPDHDEILGDQPLTPPLDPKADEFDQSDPSDIEDSQMQPFVLINNTNLRPTNWMRLNVIISKQSIYLRARNRPFRPNSVMLTSTSFGFVKKFKPNACELNGSNQLT
jgi:hypothetical protein